MLYCWRPHMSDHHKLTRMTMARTTHTRQRQVPPRPIIIWSNPIHRHITCSGHLHCKRILLISAPTSTYSLIDHINRATNVQVFSKADHDRHKPDWYSTDRAYNAISASHPYSNSRSLQRQIKQPHPATYNFIHWPGLLAGYIYLESAVDCRTAPWTLSDPWALHSVPPSSSAPSLTQMFQPSPLHHGPAASDTLSEVQTEALVCACGSIH